MAHTDAKINRYFGSKTYATIENAGFGCTETEDLAAAGAVSLTTFSTRFTTGGAETGTLAAGNDGQLKAIVMEGDGGDMVITVTNLVGGTTLTFDAVGDGCLLLYTDSKWYVIGNNGVVIG